MEKGKSMPDDNSTRTIHRGGLPSRGSILCVFRDEALIQTVEPSIARRGFALLRARSGMQGFWMAVTAQPDAILTDLPVATDEKDYLLDCLRNNRTTYQIPVLALVNEVRQSQIGPTCLRFADRCLLKKSTVNEIMDETVELIESRSTQSKPYRKHGERVIRVDAVFSELGTTAARSKKYRSAHRQRTRAELGGSASARASGIHDRTDEPHLGDLDNLQRTTSARIARHLHSHRTKDG